MTCAKAKLCLGGLQPCAFVDQVCQSENGRNWQLNAIAAMSWRERNKGKESKSSWYILGPNADELPQSKTTRRKSFRLWVIFRLCGLEPYLDLAGDRLTIRHAIFHSSRHRVDILLMERTFSCLLLKYSSYHSWRCTQPGLQLIVQIT